MKNYSKFLTLYKIRKDILPCQVADNNYQTPNGKLDQLWEGPYNIEKIDSDVNTTIKIKNKLKTVHNNDLKIYNKITE